MLRANMQTSKTTNAASVTPTMADINKLTPSQAAVRAFGEIRGLHRAFITVAKVGLRLEPTLKPGQTLGGVIIKLANVPAEFRRRVKSTIDNARYAMRVWKELVEPGHVTEEQFDDFTFADCFSINRVMSGASRQTLKPGDVAMFLQMAPLTWHEELDSLFTYGQTVEDREAAEKAKAAKAAAETAPEPSATQQPDADAPTDVPTAEPETETAKPSAEPGETAPPADTGAEPDTSDDSKVVQFTQPSVTGDSPGVEEILNGINALGAAIGSLPADQLPQIVPAIDELHRLVHEAIAPKVVAKAPAKRKAARKAKTHSKKAA
jgi:hypothetical protein